MRPVTVPANTDGTFSAPVILDYKVDPANILLSFEANGNSGGSYAVQFSADDPYATYATSYNANAVWYSHPTMTGMSANTVDNLNVPARAVRLNGATAGTGGTPTLIIIQAGTIS